MTMWMRLMAIAFLTNGLGAFGLTVVLRLSAEYKFPYLALWYGAGFLLAAAIFFRRDRTLLNAREWFVSAGMGACSAIGWVSIAYALECKIPGHVIFPVAIGGSLFFVALTGVLFFKERVSPYGLAGILLGVPGIVILCL